MNAGVFETRILLRQSFHNINLYSNNTIYKLFRASDSIKAADFASLIPQTKQRLKFVCFSDNLHAIKKICFREVITNYAPSAILTRCISLYFICLLNQAQPLLDECIINQPTFKAEKINKTHKFSKQLLRLRKYIKFTNFPSNS